MTLDNGKIDRAVLALLYLGLHDGFRAWKGFDWEALNRLHEKGLISNPGGKAKSVVFSATRLTGEALDFPSNGTKSISSTWWRNPGTCKPAFAPGPKISPTPLRNSRRGQVAEKNFFDK
jgi:hypothetical protein